MTPNIDPYYCRPEVSNSDLTWLKKYWMPAEQVYDIEAAFRFGKLVDAMITEPSIVNYYRYTVAGEQYTPAEFTQAEEMKRAFINDPYCAAILGIADKQKVIIAPNFEITFEDFQFLLAVRIKMDLYARDKVFMMGADIKSTSCTTQKSFEESVRYFDYHRQGAWYMDIGCLDQFMIVGISKINRKIFKVPMTRHSELYKEGRRLYQELAFRWCYLFEDLKDSWFTCYERQPEQNSYATA